MAGECPEEDGSPGPATPSVRYWDVSPEDKAAVVRLERAVRAAKRVVHPNICRVRGLVRKEPGIGVVTDPLPPITLAEVLRAGPLELRQLKELAADLCAGLDAAHARGVVHGNLKTASIRVAEGRFVVEGLGLEQAKTTVRLDERTDVHAVGSVLYEAATGVPPFEAPMERLPGELRASLLRCLQRDPGRRFGTIAELARALGVPVGPQSTSPRRGRGRMLAASALVAGIALLIGIVTWGMSRRAASLRARSTPVPAQVPALVDLTGTARTQPNAPTVVVAMVGFQPVPQDERAWMVRGLKELVAARLAEARGLELSTARLDEGVLLAAARKAQVHVVLSGTAASRGGGLEIDVKLLDVATGALRVAERIALHKEEDLLPAAHRVVGNLVRSLGPLFSADSGDAEPPLAAFKEHVQGLIAASAHDTTRAEAAFRQAMELAPSFLPPRLHLIELLKGTMRDSDADALLTESKALFEAASGTWKWEWQRLAARSHEERISALSQLAARRPHDPTLARQLSGAFLEAGRATECMAQGLRSLELDPAAMEVHEHLAWCSLMSGDPKAAIEHARVMAEGARDAGRWETLGDILLQLGRYGEARGACRRGAQEGQSSSAAKEALVDLHGRGKCLSALKHVKKAVLATSSPAADEAEAIALTWAAVATTCRDDASAREAEAYARRATGGSGTADEIAAWAAAARGAKGSFSKARERALDSRSLRGDIRARARHHAVLLFSARMEGRSAEGLSLIPRPPAPQDRYALYSFPLLFEIALARSDVGDTEEAQLACSELAAAAPGFAPARYCLGRVAESRGAWAEAFHHYRAFLDRWADADEEHRLVRDAKRRLREAVRRAREGKGRPDGKGAN
ncbi:MAG: hypothetical protein HY698_11960 [Deltaproteobacteria bacterium]|nr:hypothetical protein [Deltaproteobacteria bacterium]